MDDKLSPDQVLKTARLISVAILAGQLIFGIIVFVLHRTGDTFPLADAADYEMLCWIGAAVAIPALAGVPLAKRAIFRSADASDVDAVLKKFIVGTVAGLAMLEAASMLNLVLWMIYGLAWPNLVAAGVAFAASIAAAPLRRSSGSS